MRDILFSAGRSITRAALALVMLGTALGAQQPPAAGQWEGTIDVPGQALGVVVRLYRQGDGWSGTIDIPAQGASNLPLMQVTADGRSARFTIQGPAGSPTFAGTVSDDGAAMAGTFTQGTASMPFRLARTGEATAPPARRRPQLPLPPFPYDVLDVTIPTPTPGVTLAGTLVTGESRFDDLPDVLARLADGSLPALCHTISYDLSQDISDDISVDALTAGS